MSATRHRRNDHKVRNWFVGLVFPIFSFEYACVEWYRVTKVKKREVSAQPIMERVA